MEVRRVGLRPLLLGPPLTERGSGDPTAKCLTAHMSGIAELLPQVYGNSAECVQAVSEVQALVRETEDPDLVVCKRAALLFALHREKEIGRYFVEQERMARGEKNERGERGDRERTFAEDMRDRVLPFLLPRFVKNSCQTPDRMLVLAIVLQEMWEGEQLGNWPLKRGRAYHDAAIGELHQGGHSKRGRPAA